MATKPTLTSFLFPLLLPVLAFFVAYFLFPSFSREFFGVSVKGNAIGNEVPYSIEKQNESENKEYTKESAPKVNNTKNDEVLNTDALDTIKDIKTIVNPEFTKQNREKK